MIAQCWYYRIPHSCFSTTLKTIAHFCAAQKQKTCDWKTCTLAARWTCWVVSWRSLNTATTSHDATCNRRKKGKSEVQWVVCATEWPARPVLPSHWCCYTLDLSGFFFQVFSRWGRVKSEIFQGVKSKNYPVFCPKYTSFYVSKN